MRVLTRPTRSELRANHIDYKSCCHSEADGVLAVRICVSVSVFVSVSAAAYVCVFGALSLSLCLFLYYIYVFLTPSLYLLFDSRVSVCVLSGRRFVML